MTSKREEERNEKIIRGLMKLPPNRRCINCNSMGPQYVCTNFWTFVCTICSGIHREFTHRVKSVSMSKFTSQEVEALQSGGNQRARETYLKDWDLQRQRLPNSSDADKVRGFIKAVYVDRKYAGGNKSEKLQKDIQNEKLVADEARRASSYHSFSQSPPYDFQYEERLNRKQGGVSLSRKPGSDRSLFERKAASFVYSPGRFSDHHYEDRFANEGSSSRVSDYSVSSGGDPFRSAPQSPNLQKDDGFSSPISDSSREIDGLQRQTSSTCSEAVVRRDADRVPAPRPQKSMSSGSFGSFDKITGSLHLVGSGSSLVGVMEPNYLAVNNQNKAFAFPAPSQLPTENSGHFNHFKGPSGMPACSPTSAVDLFEAPAAGSAVSIDLKKSPDSSVVLQPSEATDEGWAAFDLPQPSKAGPSTQTTGSHSEFGISSQSLDSVSSPNVVPHWSDFQNIAAHVPVPCEAPAALDLFEAPAAGSAVSVDLKKSPDSLVGSQKLFPPSSSSHFPETSQKPSVPNSNQKMLEPSEATDEGWAAFDLPQLSKAGPSTQTTGTHSEVGISSQSLDSVSSPNVVPRWSDFQNIAAHVPAPFVSDLWNEGPHMNITNNVANSEWKAFEGNDEHQHQRVDIQGIGLQVSVGNTSSSFDLFQNAEMAEDSTTNGLAKLASNEGFSFPTLPSHNSSGSTFDQPIHPFMADISNTGQRSINPFDATFDSEFEANNTFLNMSTLQAALPSTVVPSPYAGGINESWFPLNPMDSQGAMSFITAQAPSSQLTNVPSHGPVTSVGGNPFA